MINLTIPGFYIINNNMITLAEGKNCSHPDSATVTKYDTLELMEAAHLAQFPDHPDYDET